MDVAVLGGGIVGISVARALTEAHPGLAVTVFEKEAALASHQTGRNSGVIHSGVYYKPGSLKAELATRASSTMVAFCQEHGIDHDVCGKLIVASTPEQQSKLQSLADRGRANGIATEVLSPEQAAEREPHLVCLGAIWVPTAGIVDYGQVALTLADQARAQGVDIRLNTAVERLERTERGWRVHATNTEPVEARFIVNCGGLQSDRIARLTGADPGARIVPFRGEYFDIVTDRKDLVKGLIYPVPDLRFPFLGVHLTRGIHGSVHAGPNAVLALAREGYRWRDVSPADLAETLRYPGFWKLAKQHWRYGISEMARSASKSLFVKSVQELVPELEAHDLKKSSAGVRAQAVAKDGSLVDDFLLVEDDHALHVTNAPSPAATASIEIGRRIAEQATVLI